MGVYNFDQQIDRRHSDSIKWTFYPEGVLPAWVADMDFPAANEVIAAIKTRADHGVFGYAFDSPDLRALIVERLARWYGWTIQPSEILFLPGLVPAIHLMCMMFGKAGDQVLIHTPVYPPFLHAPHLFEQSAKAIPLIEQVEGQRLSYTIDFEQTEAAITPQTKFMLISHPHNPIGRSFTPEELRKLGAICERHGVIMVSDEIHCDLMLDGHQHTPFAAVCETWREHTITMMAPSKSFNLAGLGCSFLIIQNPQLHQEIMKTAFGLLPLVNVMGFTAAAAAYQHGQAWLDELLPYLARNRDLVCEYIETHLPMLRVTRPEATYLAWIDARGLGVDDPYQFFLNEAKVGLGNGQDFGAPGYVRLNFGCPQDTLLEILERMRTAIQQRSSEVG
ncbi:MAG: PatB family C-S lyase [Anaerolineae bacterium]|jgi:cystathionine beta-lyase|nr:PatB family C-S lyase [Anaerolineae bacterium]